MRIIHVVLSLGVGGQEVLILELSRALQARGHEVEVVSLTPGGGLADEFGPIRVRELPRGRGIDVRLFARLYRLFRERRPDVVHSHNTAPLVYAAPAARAARVPCVVHTKHGEHAGGHRTLLLARAASRLVSAFVAVSPPTAEVAKDREWVQGTKLTVIPNGVRVEDYQQGPAARAAARAELGIPEGAVVIGSIGRFVDDKDYPLLVRAAAPLLSDGVRLLIVGDGPTYERVRECIDERASPFVVLPGRRRDVAQLLSAMDVFTLSSRTEGLPVALVEAMAAGLPVVATSVGGLPHAVPAEVGVLVPPGDDRALGRALSALVADPGSRARLGAAARSHAAQAYSLERVTDSYEALYRARG